MKQIDGRHIYEGNCPDDKDNGPYARDPKCPVCRALMLVELIGVIHENHNR